ncbi:MAG: CtpF protein, partial [Hyphomicrobium sp.]
ALDLKAIAVIDYDCETFSQAANNGQMIEEFNAKCKATEKFRDIAMKMTKRKDMRTEKPAASPLSGLGPLLEKFKLKR